jgi:hypothetical protein
MAKEWLEKGWRMTEERHKKTLCYPIFITHEPLIA